MLIAFAASFAWGGDLSGTVTLTGKPVGPVIVYVKHVDGQQTTTFSESTVQQINVEFKPGTLVVPAGSTVHFPNLDKVWHNVFSLSPGNEFDLGLYRGGTSQSVQLKNPGEVEVYCNIHPSMAAHILVVQNTFFAEADESGNYLIKNVPNGKYELVAWERTHKPLVREVLVADGQTTKMNYTLEFDESAMQHLNKHNELYGRYQ